MLYKEVCGEKLKGSGRDNIKSRPLRYSSASGRGRKGHRRRWSGSDYIQSVRMAYAGAFITGSTFLADGGATSSYYYGPLQP